MDILKYNFIPAPFLHLEMAREIILQEIEIYNSNNPEIKWEKRIKNNLLFNQWLKKVRNEK